MRSERATALSGQRLVLLVVAGLLSGAATLAIGILLFGDFGSTEGRILASIAVVAGYGLLTLPAAALRDQRRLLVLATGIVALAIVGAALGIAAIWWQDGPPDVLGKTVGTVTGCLVAAVQVAALAVRRGEQDPTVVRRLFAASCVAVIALAAMFTALLWAEDVGERYIRFFGALVVLDALLVALQPIFARVRPTTTLYRLRIVVAPQETVELAIEARDAAAAATQAIRAQERDGRRVLLVEFTDSGVPGSKMREFAD